MATLDSKFLDAIISKDQELDDLEVEINDNAFELISLRSPVISDLRRVISAIKNFFYPRKGRRLRQEYSQTFKDLIDPGK